MLHFSSKATAYVRIMLNLAVKQRQCHTLAVNKRMRSTDLAGCSRADDGVCLARVLDHAHERERDTVAVGGGDHGAKEGVQEVEIGAEEHGVQAVEAHKGGIELVHVAHAVCGRVAPLEEIIVVSVERCRSLAAAATAHVRQTTKWCHRSRHQLLPQLGPPLTAALLPPRRIGRLEHVVAVEVGGRESRRVTGGGSAAERAAAADCSNIGSNSGTAGAEYQGAVPEDALVATIGGRKSTEGRFQR
jgi:hypothetical protein